MQIRFLRGPAGSGKTFECIQDIRNELRRSPEGLPLIFIAPKQATFQIERQLLSEDLEGFSRLQVLSFERLARFILAQSEVVLPEILAEEGRVMVLRALLEQTHRQLAIFHSCARRVAFARELSAQLREFQSHAIGPNELVKMAEELGSRPRLKQKLSDLALLFREYRSWLQQHQLQDADALLDAATAALEGSSASAKSFRIAGLWLDGFAQLTPQERKLLLALLPFCEKASLAFCLDPEKEADSSGSLHSKLSPWRLVNGTAQKLQAEISQKFGPESLLHVDLRRRSRPGRFDRSPSLAHLEEHWASAEPCNAHESIQLVECADPTAEAVFCARQILRHVRNGGRFREIGILTRHFENEYPEVFRRVFQRYEIPFFLDQREGVAHHPLAELTRGALRTLAFNFRMEDWFATLKTGLAYKRSFRAAAHFKPRASHYLDELENEALARGWEGDVWINGFPRRKKHDKRFDQWRGRVVQPFLGLKDHLGANPSGQQLAQGLRKLWQTLGIELALDTWTRYPTDGDRFPHNTVYTQMLEWLENLERAFLTQHRPLVEWLPIVESGLASLSVGLIPPALDHVLIGAVDRSRNPDLKEVLVVGFNECLFPLGASQSGLLSDDDREALRAAGSELGDIPALRLAREQFFGYIACTRPRERLSLLFSACGSDGKPRNRSRFVAHLQRIFPGLHSQFWTLQGQDLMELEHPCELGAFKVNSGVREQLLSGPGARLEEWRNRYQKLTAPPSEDQLEPGVALDLYGSELRVSVTALEQFAMCPFRFFVRQGLRLYEREKLQLDSREQGSFQHEVLSRFHKELKAEGQRWRDISAAEARERVSRIADDLMQEFHEGLLGASAENRFTFETYKLALQQFITQVRQWLDFYRFEPSEVELPFGGESSLPGWRIPLDNGCAIVVEGRADRLDIFVKDGKGFCIVLDYKSSQRKPDRVLLHYGIQQQLPLYLLALASIPEVAALFRVSELVPAGCFIVPLRPMDENCRDRQELFQPESGAESPFLHLGLFNVEYLEHLDSAAPTGRSGQFKYALKKDGDPDSRTFSALKSQDFRNLLARTRELVQTCAREVYQGHIAIKPFKRGSVTACSTCDYSAICRFDSWVQPYRVLTKPGTKTVNSHANGTSEEGQ